MYKLTKNYYSGITKFYFDVTLKSIIKIGDLNNGKKNILDFGCGFGELKKKVIITVYNYDKVMYYSDYKNWKTLDFNYFVANQVIYLFSEEELINLLDSIKKINSETILIIGISKQNLFSKILKNVLNFKNAHLFTKLNYKEQIDILNYKCVMIKKIDNFFLITIFLYKLK